MRVFSGIQPSGKIHIGNYLGSVKQWQELQGKYDSLFCVADLHSLTVLYEPKELEEKIEEKIVTYLAAGIDPNKSIIFIQSQVKEHTELTWLLSTVTPVGDLQRMIQFKEKSKKEPENVNAGLLNYPILMAADILLYDTNIVPVGIDQSQHVEMAQLIARKFNKRFGETFVIPKAYIPKTGAKIMSLVDPSKKMSKSDKNSKSYITLFDSPEEIRKKISSAQTDSGKEIKYNPETKPGISNLLTIYSLFSGMPLPKIEEKFKQSKYQEFKNDLAELLIEKLAPFREAKKEYRQEKIRQITEEGRRKAQELAKKKMQEVKEKMGLPLT